MPAPRQPIDLLLLDAMGVLYVEGDDVGALLMPFLREHGSGRSLAEVDELYGQASVGRLDSRGFWEALGLDPALEADYLARYRRQEGLERFLEGLPAGLRLAALSNDLSAWSRQLRTRFALEPRIPDWIVSGDVGLSKPDPRIYDLAVARLGVPPERILFVDDRPVNVRAARAQGLQAVRFDPGAGPGDEPGYGFEALARLLAAR